TGIMHSYQWTESDTVLKLSPAWPFAIAYAAIALIFFAANWITEPADEHEQKFKVESSKQKVSSKSATFDSL
ncbi:MAG TPA: hypothetical protein VKB36_15810, partial [Vicinamibacterales bacterium]|nr:hypothetical protein [Vicinamibacterales bacterium]